MRTRLAAALLLVLGIVPQAHAAVSCADPDNLCTGDPCTITNADVESPCVIDFGPRAVFIAGILRVPDDGIMEFTAGTTRVQGPIDGLVKRRTGVTNGLLEPPSLRRRQHLRSRPHRTRPLGEAGSTRNDDLRPLRMAAVENHDVSNETPLAPTWTSGSKL